MHESLRLWCDNIDRENREAWSAFETYCREIEEVTGAEHYSLVPSEAHRKVQQCLGLWRQYGSWELGDVLRTRFSNKHIRESVRKALEPQS